MPPPRRTYPLPDLKLLWGLAAARCAFQLPHCRHQCIEDATDQDPAVPLGIIAHIVAHADEGPRANPSMSIQERDCYDNWILLCDRHARLVDVRPRTHSEAELRRWKAEHEQWVRASLAQEMPEVGFAELEVVAQALLGTPQPPAADLAVLNPAEKMARNGLTQRVHYELTLGLGKAREVREFVRHVAMRDGDFPERLKTGFIVEYRALRQKGIEGDALFESLRIFAGGRRTQFRQQAAGLAVLAYLFEACEVFER